MQIWNKHIIWMNEGEYHNNVETKLTDSSFCSRINKLEQTHTHNLCHAHKCGASLRFSGTYSWFSIERIHLNAITQIFCQWRSLAGSSWNIKINGNVWMLYLLPWESGFSTFIYQKYISTQRTSKKDIIDLIINKMIRCEPNLSLICNLCSTIYRIYNSSFIFPV